jgi:hypothetical protein
MSSIIAWNFISHGINTDLFHRWCISYGKIFQEYNMTIDPVIDNVTQLHEPYQWIGASLTPSASNQIPEDKDPKQLNLLKYDIPVKKWIGEGWFCN